MAATLLSDATTHAPADPYAALVRYYDAETAHKRDDLAAYAALAHEHPGRVLDVGCGTGRVAFDLARRGRRVTGIDTSAPMLERARGRALREGVAEPSIAWLEADVTTLALDERFGLAIYAYNGFMHLLEQPRQIAALEHIAQHLGKGGILAIDLPNPVEMFSAEDTPGLALERVFADPETGDQVMQQSLSTVDRATQIMSVTWVYDRIDPQGVVHRHLVPLRLRYTMAPELALLLARAGFHEVELYGDYDFSPCGEDSPRLFAVARLTDGAL